MIEAADFPEIPLVKCAFRHEMCTALSSAMVDGRGTEPPCQEPVNAAEDTAVDSSLKPSETLLWGADGFVELYPVQVAAWRITAGGHSTLHDICISAPTGSGKTLAYVLPIVQGLLG